MFSSKLPQNRHPERSASHIYRVTQRSGAESKDPEDAYLVDAVRSFSTTQAGEWDFSYPLRNNRPVPWQRSPPFSNPLLFVIPTEANPDFLPRSARQSHVCAFLLRKGA
jgi:hypothetical protein